MEKCSLVVICSKTKYKNFKVKGFIASQKVPLIFNSQKISQKLCTSMYLKKSEFF